MENKNIPPVAKEGPPKKPFEDMYKKSDYRMSETYDYERRLKLWEQSVQAEDDLKARIENILWDFGDHGCVHYEPYVTQIIELLTPKTPENRLRHILEVVDNDLSVMEGKQLRDIQQFIRTELYKVDNEVVTPNEEEQEEQNKAWLELTEDIGSIRNARFDQWLMVQEKKFKLVRR